MDSGQYRQRQRPQNHSLPLEYPFVDNLGYSIQPTQHMVSFDGPSQSHAQPFVINPPATLPSSFGLTSPTTSLPQSSPIWSDPNTLSFDDQTMTPNYYGYSPVVTSSEQDDSLPQGINFASIPRSWPHYDLSMLNDNIGTDGFEHTYMLETNQGNVQNSTDEDHTMTEATSYVRMSISQSPKVENDSQEPHLSPTKDTGPDSDDGDCSSRELTAVDTDEHTVDEHTAEGPYAKLIHRALMSVPSHSMFLQEIYQWFRENTEKGNRHPESTGWQNSIRHNLSMNAAFRKTNRKLPGDKKACQWVLEDFAIKNGVQSTTRYRKSPGLKRLIRPDHLTTSRQSSSRKGGISAYKSKTTCKSKTAYKSKTQRRAVQDDRNDFRGSRGSFLHSQYPYPAPAVISQRHSATPSTPDHEITAGPTLYFHPKTEPVRQSFNGVVRGLQDVHGVYHDDVPLFTNENRGLYF